MNTRPNVNQQTAEGVVRESLGLTAEDLGMNPPEDSFANDDFGGEDDGGSEDNLSDNDSGLPDNSGLQTNDTRVAQQDDLTVQPQRVQPQPDKIPAAAEIRTDGKGNLVDKKTGQIVARAGAEARMYQKMHKQSLQMQAIQAQHTDTENRLRKAVEIGTQLFERLKAVQENQGNFAPSKYGLADHEAVEALNFAKMAKSDPIGAIKAVLTRAAAGGIDLSSIGLQGGNFDPKSLMDLVGQRIDQAMNPLRERSQRETEQERQTREAQQEAESAKQALNTFLAQNPEAREYLPVFHQVYSQPQFQHMSLGEVWSRLQLNLLRRSQQQQQQRPANQRQGRNPRIPNGRGRPPQSGNGNGNLAPVDMSYEDIVRGLLPPT